MSLKEQLAEMKALNVSKYPEEAVNLVLGDILGGGIIGISGSPIKNGNTDRVIIDVLDRTGRKTVK